jgi:DNA polymerase I
MGKDVFPGMLVEYVVTPGNGSISNRSVPAENAKDYDPEYYAENQVLPAVERIFEALGGETDDLKAGQKGKQKSLSSFF